MRIKVLLTQDTSTEPQARVSLIPSWLLAGRVVLFSGRGGTGKSCLTLQVAAATALGKRHRLPSPDGVIELETGTAVRASWEGEPDEALPVAVQRANWWRVAMSNIRQNLRSSLTRRHSSQPSLAIPAVPSCLARKVRDPKALSSLHAKSRGDDRSSKFGIDWFLLAEDV